MPLGNKIGYYKQSYEGLNSQIFVNLSCFFNCMYISLEFFFGISLGINIAISVVVVGAFYTPGWNSFN